MPVVSELVLLNGSGCPSKLSNEDKVTLLIPEPTSVTPVICQTTSNDVDAVDNVCISLVSTPPIFWVNVLNTGFTLSITSIIKGSNRLLVTIFGGVLASVALIEIFLSSIWPS